MKKKFVAAAISAAMVMSMAACGGSSTETTAAATTAATTAASTTEATTAAATTAAQQETTAGSEITDLAAYAAEGMQTSIECEPIEFSLGCSGTVEGTILGYAISDAGEALKTWTNGNVVVNFYPSGQLGGDIELIEGAQMGSVDMFIGAPTSQVGLIPELAVLDIAGLYENVESCNTVLETFKDQIEPYYNNAGLHLLAMGAPDFRILSSNKQVETAADLQGLNIRTQENKYHMEFWKQLGTNPTPLAFGELYIALQQGMMDAQENPWASIVGAKICEVQKYIVETNHIPFVSTIVMNQAKYEGLSDNQKLALDQYVQFIMNYQVAGTTEDDLRMKGICETEYGITVTPVSEEIKALYENATQAVIDLMKKDIDPTFVDEYVAAAKAAAQ